MCREKVTSSLKWRARWSSCSSLRVPVSSLNEPSLLYSVPRWAGAMQIMGLASTTAPPKAGPREARSPAPLRRPPPACRPVPPGFCLPSSNFPPQVYGRIRFRTGTRVAGHAFGQPGPRDPAACASSQERKPLRYSTSEVLPQDPGDRVACESSCGCAGRLGPVMFCSRSDSP
jgi:hypothetical protein